MHGDDPGLGEILELPASRGPSELVFVLVGHVYPYRLVTQADKTLQES